MVKLRNLFLGLCIYMPLLSMQLYDESMTRSIMQAVHSNFKKITVYAYQDHPTVTQSLVHGLQVLGINFNFNPSLEKVGDAVIVLAGLQTLNAMIDLKKQKKIKVLVTGPNIVAKAYDYNKIVASLEVDNYLTPSEFVKNIGEVELPERHDHIRSWYAGVDESYWKPNGFVKKKNKALVYWKTESKEFCDAVCHELRENGWKPLVVRYGKYNKAEYKAHLEKVKMAIFLSKTESQGIALAEAWSMDVPTFVWDSAELYKGVILTSCPYINESVGMRWKTMKELKDIINHCDLSFFCPREWVLANMTDRISALQLLKIMVEAA